MSNVYDIVRDRNILIIEDQLLIAMELIDILEELGASSIEHIARVQDVLPALQQKRPDAVILDLNLQGVSSRAIATALIAMGIPVVLSTGYAKAEVAAEFPGVPVFEKPCDPQNIIAALSTILIGKKDLSGPTNAAKRMA